MHAGGAAELAGAVGHGSVGAAQKFLAFAKSLAGEACAAGDAVINKNGGRAGLGVHGRGNAAQVVAVGQDQQGKNTDGRVLQGVDGAHEMDEPGFGLALQAFRNGEPQALGFKLQGWKVQGHDA